ncbi:xanthine dehydrogenase family protein molybdopterin-binding subunit [Bosea sp. 685]|uniref:xanthine dehydrogenase family protein molybdopterin-binding subunit n=1 Tax=Bosea sp. 685 TaxID=3080057 RepID=UPI00289320CC|nr:xanthine dehydrogenase family protein molybdopterin-binding subunit [Bosea sp. 685]WNJ93753.1 xanthine dehydrogenase family protein molybdopterin-binding subunit [Bosea sp. 685]
MNDGLIASDTMRMVPAPDDPRSLRRREDQRFLTGTGRYLDDHPVPGELFAAMVRSPHAHARILSIDSAAAAEMPGVRGIYTAGDLDGLHPLPCYIVVKTVDPLIVPPRFPLARERVRHVGDLVAFVVAESREAARDACEQVVVDYDILPSVTELRSALDPQAAQIWPEAPGNLAFRFERGDREAVAKAFASAAHVASCDLVNNRIVAAAMEPRIALGRFDPASGVYSLAISGASVHAIRRELAEGVFGLPLDRIEVSCPDVGGGFGMKNVTYPEYALVLWAARKLARPVHWTADRLDEFTSGVHGRDNLTKARLALDAKGHFLALAVETLGNLGAYVSSLGPGSSTNAPSTAMGGLYDIPAMTMDVRGVFTNTVPIDAYRGAGKPEANYLLERLIDTAAHQLAIDPAELRRRNFIRRFPHRSAFGSVIDCGTFTENLDRVLAAADRAGFAKRKREAKKRGKLRGFGIGCFLETSRGQPNEEAWLSVRRDGAIDMAVGTQSNGQGHETSFAQVAAQRLGLPVETFRLVQGDTALVPRGGGHGGARSLHLGGTALLMAADDLVARALPVAAQLLQVGAGELAFGDGRFRTVAGADGLAKEIDLFTVARHVAESTGAALSSHGDNICDVITFPNGAQVAEVEIDPQTGAVSLERYVAVDDYGRLVNPLLTEAQVHGGLAQGIGQALLEEALYDPDSGQLLSATFMDYAMPRADDIPFFDLEMVEVPTKANPLGAKGSGQAGCIGAPQTVMNAVLDALRPLGVTHLDMPATPARVWRAIRDAQAAAGKS